VSHFTTQLVRGPGLRSTLLNAFATVAIATMGTACGGGGTSDNAPSGGSGGNAGGESQAGDGASVAAVGCTVKNEELLAARVWRLSHPQYANSVQKLLPQADLAATKNFLPDEQLGVFSNDAVSLRVSSVRADQYALAARAFADATSARVSSLLPCSADKVDSACVTSFIETFARRAFRRPLEADESKALQSVWDEGKASSGIPGGLAAIVEVVLQSPSFLYRTEVGEPSSTGDRVELTANELASALSFSLTNQPPDDEMLALVADGKLKNVETIRQQVRRLMKSQEGRNNFAAFVNQWMDYGPLKGLQLSDPAFKDWGSVWAPRLNKELELYVKHVLEKDDATISDLMLSRTTFADAELGRIYGAEVKGSEFSPVDLSATPRMGLLTMPGFLASHAVDGASHPVKRGIFVNQRLLCRTLPTPPAGAGQLSTEARKPGLTARERQEIHRMEPRCASCHNTIDPPGLVFENFDGVGRYRTQDEGKNIDTSGTLEIDDKVSITFKDAPDFAQQLIQTERFKNCATQQQLRYFTGINQTDADTCGVRAIAFESGQAGDRLDRTIEAIATSPLFRFRLPASAN
jgi:hypothetical protein